MLESNQWVTQLPGNEFDYLALMHALRDYKRPRDKVSKLLRRGDIIRLKKGIYILGKRWRHGTDINREILANLLYGPSYISLEYALAWHQLIPERVEALTSVTLNKSKQYATPAGYFRYRHIKPAYYQQGILLLGLPDGRTFLIATPEKAVADKVYFTKGLKTLDHLQQYLFEDLRLEQAPFQMKTALFHELTSIDNKLSLRLLSQLAGGLT